MVMRPHTHHSFYKKKNEVNNMYSKRDLPFFHQICVLPSIQCHSVPFQASFQAHICQEEILKNKQKEYDSLPGLLISVFVLL